MMRAIIVLCLFLAAFSHAQTYLSNYQTSSTYISKYNPASFYIYGQGLSQIQLNTTTSTYGYGYQVFVTVNDYYGGGNNDTFVLYPSGVFSSFNLVDNLGNSYQYKYITITTESYYSIEISIQPNIGASMIQMEPGVSYLGLTSSTKSTNFGYYSTQGFTVQYSGDYVQFYLSNSNYATPYNYIAALNSYYNTPTNYSVNPCELASTGSISGSWYINVPTHTYKKQYTLAILPASDVEVETIYTNQPYYPSISSSSSTFKVYLTSGYLTTLNISDYSSVPSGSMSYSVSMYYGDCASSSSNTISTIYGSGALAFFSTITGYYTINIKTPYESQVFSLQVNQIAPNTLESVLDLVSSISNTQFQFDTYTPIYFKYTGPSISIYLSTSVNAYIKKGSLPSSSDYDYSYYSSVITIGDCDDESSTYYIGITTSYSSNSYITIMSSLPTECGTSGTGYGSSGYVPISYHSYHSSSINLVVIIVPAVFCVVCIIILAIVIAVRNKRRLNRAKKHGEVTYTTNNKGEHKYTQLETMPSYVPTAQYVQPQVYAYPANYYHPNYPTVAPGYIVPSQLPPQLNQQLPSYITPIGPTPPFYTIPNPVQLDNINNTIVPEEKK